MLCQPMMTMLYTEPVSVRTTGARRTLRRLELEAYASVISAFRAQGQLTRDKKSSLEILCKCLGISGERHRAEVRRAVNDELLSSVACSISGVESEKAWRREGQKLSSTNPRLVTHRAFSHGPQVLAASASAAAIMTAQPSSMTAAGGTANSTRKMPNSIQNALQKIMSQNPGKTQQQQPAQPPSSPPIKVAQRVNTSTSAAKAVSDPETVPVGTPGGARVVEEVSSKKDAGSVNTKGKAYSQLESLLCEEYLTQRLETKAEDRSKEQSKGASETVEQNIATPQTQLPSVTTVEGNRDSTETLVNGSTAGDQPRRTVGTRKRPLSVEENIGVPTKKQALETSAALTPNSPAKKPEISSPLKQSTPPKQPPPSKATQQISPPKGATMPSPSKQPEQQTPPPTQHTPVKQSTPPTPSSPKQPSSGVGNQVQSTPPTTTTPSLSVATPTVPPIGDPPATESLIKDLVSDTSDTAVFSLANQLGLADVTPSLLNLSDFMSMIQPSAGDITPSSVPEDTAPVSCPVDDTGFAQTPPPPLTPDPSRRPSLPPARQPPPLMDMSAVTHLPQPLTPAHDVPLLGVTPDLISSPVMVRPSTLGLSEHESTSSQVLLTALPASQSETTPSQIISVATPTVQDIPVATPTVQDIPMATPTVPDDSTMMSSNYLDLTDIGSLMGNANDSELLEGIPEDMAKSIQTLLQLDQQTWN